MTEQMIIFLSGFAFIAIFIGGALQHLLARIRVLEKKAKIKGEEPHWWTKRIK